MTDYVEYKPPAEGVAPRGWQEGMAWDTEPFNVVCFNPSGGNPCWNNGSLYRVPPAALHYPIVPHECEWGADIAVEDRPEWLPDGQACDVFEVIKWRKVLSWDDNQCRTVTKIRLPASHGYYADNPASDEAHYDGAAPTKAFNLDTWLSEAKANLSAIEAAGHSVTFAPDWAEQLWRDTRLMSFNDAMRIIRSRVRPVL